MGKWRSATSLFPPSFPLFSHEVHVCPYGPRKTKVNDESKVCNRTFQLEQMQNLDCPRQATGNCTATNWLSFNLSITTIFFILLQWFIFWRAVFSCVDVIFAALCYINAIFCSPTVEWLTNKQKYYTDIKNELNDLMLHDSRIIIFTSSIWVRITRIAQFFNSLLKTYKEIFLLSRYCHFSLSGSRLKVLKKMTLQIETRRNELIFTSIKPKWEVSKKKHFAIAKYVFVCVCTYTNKLSDT